LEKLIHDEILIVPMTMMATSATIFIFSELITEQIPHGDDSYPCQTARRPDDGVMAATSSKSKTKTQRQRFLYEDI
jgi:hypothetical protein